MAFKSTPQDGPPKASLPPTRSSTPTIESAKALFNNNLSKIQSTGSIEDELVPATPSVEQVLSSEATASTTTPADTSTGKVEEESISSQFAALARKEKAQRARVQAEQAKLKADRDAFETERQALKSQQEEYSTKYIPKDRLQNDTLNALQEAGLPYDQIVQLMLQQQENPAMAQSDAKVRALEAKLAQMEQSQKKSFEDLQKDNEQAALNQITFDVRRTIKGNPEFETIEKTGSYKEVVELIEKTYKEGLGEDYPRGTVMDIETAAKMVESEIEEELYKYASSVSKIQKRLQPKAAATSQATQTQSNKEQDLKTLTNRSTSSKPLTARERAIRRFQGQPVD